MWLEGSALGQLMRTAGVWSYGVVNLVHILGLSTLFGSVLVLDLRLLGAWRRVPLTALESPDRHARRVRLCRRRRRAGSR